MSTAKRAGKPFALIKTLIPEAQDLLNCTYLTGLSYHNVRIFPLYLIPVFDRIEE